MDWHIGIMLIAIVFTYLAWRRARRQNELARARSAALEEPRWTYRLEAVDGAAETGYRIVAEDEAGWHSEAPDWDRDGIEIMGLHGADVRAAAIGDEAFEAGAGIRLVAERDDRGTAGPVSVWDEGRAIHLGWIPREHADRVAARLQTGELSDCIVLREALHDGVRAGVDLLLVHRDAAVEA
jgi:hypothetical protein